MISRKLYEHRMRELLRHEAAIAWDPDLNDDEAEAEFRRIELEKARLYRLREDRDEK